MREIESKIQETQEKLAKYGYHPINVTWSIDKLKKGVAGAARYSTNHIKISEDFLREHSGHIFETTIPHEVCHLYVGEYYPRAKQHHGPEFRRLMNLLGLPGDTYHKLKLSNDSEGKRLKTRYIYTIKEPENSLREFKLTKGEHLKVLSGHGKFFSSDGKELVYTGKTIQYK